MRWLNEEQKLKISKKAVINMITEEDIPDEIKSFFRGVRQAIH